MTDMFIDMRGVGKRYGSVSAVQGLDLQVTEGTFVALLGSSGCGKTTTLRMIAGLEQPTSGDIFLKRQRINDIPVHRRNFGMVFQNHALFPHKTAFDNVAFGLRYRDVSAADISRRVRRALEIVRLDQIGDRYPSQLSGGQQQRVAVARAIVIEPDLLLFDEPLSALDATLREEMRSELKRIQRTLGITTIFVTHDQAEALSMADKVVVMNAGNKIEEGTPQDIFNRPQSEFAMRFFGPVNEFNGKVRSSSEKFIEVEIADGAVVKVIGQALKEAPVRLLVRAGRIRVHPTLADGGSSAGERRTLHGEIVTVEYLGLMTRYEIRVGQAVIQAIQASDNNILMLGDRADLEIQSQDWVVSGGASDSAAL